MCSSFYNSVSSLYKETSGVAIIIPMTTRYPYGIEAKAYIQETAAMLSDQGHQLLLVLALHSESGDSAMKTLAPGIGKVFGIELFPTGGGASVIDPPGRFAYPLSMLDRVVPLAIADTNELENLAWVGVTPDSSGGLSCISASPDPERLKGLGGLLHLVSSEGWEADNATTAPSANGNALREPCRFIHRNPATVPILGSVILGVRDVAPMAQHGNPPAMFYDESQATRVLETT